MDLVAVCGGENPRVTGYQTGRQGRGSGDATDHHVTVIAFRQHRPRLCGGKTGVGHRHHGSKRGMDGESQWHSLGRCEDQTPVDGRRSLIGMTLHVGSHPEDAIWRCFGTDRPQGGGSARHEGSRRRPHTPCQRNIVVDLEIERPITYCLPGGGGHTIMLGVGRSMLPDVDHRPLVGDSGTDNASGR